MPVAANAATGRISGRPMRGTGAAVGERQMHGLERQSGHPSNRRQPPAGRTSVTQLRALPRLGRHDRTDKRGEVPPPVANGTKAEKELTAMAGEGPLPTSHPQPRPAVEVDPARGSDIVSICAEKSLCRLSFWCVRVSLNDKLPNATIVTAVPRFSFRSTTAASAGQAAQEARDGKEHCRKASSEAEGKPSDGVPPSEP